MLPDYITNCIHRIAKTEGFVDYRIETEDVSSHGNNFMGLMISTKLCGTRLKNGTAQFEELQLLCKIPPGNQTRQKNFNCPLLYSRELYMYSKLLPTFVRFQQERGLSETESFLAFPKVFACETDDKTGTSFLIMEDLRPKNYVMLPKEKIFPIDNELLVMRELGKFHAISFAMKDQRPNEFEEFKQFKEAFVGVFLKTQLKSYAPTAIDRAIDAVDKSEHKKILQKFRKHFMERVENLINDPNSDAFCGINHGDLWSNNVLFQYSNDSKKELKSICFVDYQLIHYSPVVTDIMYNIFSGTDKSFRDRHYETLLKTYYKSLNEMFQKLGSDPKKLFTYDEFLMQMKKFGEYALLFGCMMTIFRIAKAKDVLNLDEYAERLERNENVQMVGKFDNETQNEFKRLVNGLVTDLVNYGYVTSE